MRKSTIAAALFALTMILTAAQPAHASIWGVITDLLDESYASYREIGFNNLTSRTVRVEVWDESGYHTSRDVQPGKQLNLMTSNPNARQTYAVRISVRNNSRWIAKDYQYWGSDARVFIDKAGRGDFYMWGYYLR